MTSRFPVQPSNLPPESVKWGGTVEQLINELLTRMAIQESRSR